MQETVIKQSQESVSSLPVLYKSEDSQPIKYNPIQEAIQLWETISQKDTVVIYQQAAAKTWNLFKQAIALISFLFFLLIALIIWVWGIAFQSGSYFRAWLEVEQPTIEQTTSAFLKFLLWPFERAYEWSNSFIKKYLGWEIKFNAIPAKSPSTQPEKTAASGAVLSESLSISQDKRI
ncbi:hypothetical protein BV372_02865 [Nostoc sp. T09]|uniref:hypothetical protein n=1 Tax=Nostoc sp. T09 TaxID=1932621 RepID=UPI000A392E05|nr:hypothetical protein [Nostoc sp. T09]OUL37352.1 hypothetical protein BV372_02865 [Nostoc sp. T09]